MIAVKNDLKILQDRDGKRLKEYQVEVVNDELIVTDEEGELFDYNPTNKESQRIQETLFHEKQTIIENCLFGVDINPNSVKICRLRLWIELLKNAYYKNATELETLPNIDINIKCGNSLVSRFAIDADLSQALKKSKWTIDSYRIAVDTYRNAESKEQKREMERLISDIKSDFRSEISLNDPKLKKQRKLSGELFQMTQQTQLFEMSKKEKADWNKKVTQLTEETKKLETEIEEIKANKIFENAFEWRFEFPEVLNDDGDFVGFDVVIWNPPYVQLQSMKEMSKQYERLNFKSYTSMGDLYALFYEKGFDILKNEGSLCFITGSAWLRSNYGQQLRSYFKNYTKVTKLIDFSDCIIFESATVLTTILSLCKTKNDVITKAMRFTKKDQDRIPDIERIFEVEHVNINEFSENAWIISDKTKFIIKEKVELAGIKLLDWNLKINYGIKTGLNEAFVIDSSIKEKLIQEDSNASSIIEPILRGRDISKNSFSFKDCWLINSHNGVKEANIPRVDIENYPSIKKFMDSFGEKLERRSDKGDTRYNLRNCAYLAEFKKPKIIYPNMTKFLPFLLDKSGYYTNQKCYFITGENLEYLISFFNSKLFKFCFEENFPELQGNTRELNKVIFEQIPVKKISDEAQQPFIKLVEEILALKKEKSDADTIDLESQIDQLVYKLYDLTEEEIKIIEGV